MAQKFKAILQALVYGNFWICLGSISLVFFSEKIIKVPFQSLLALFIALSTFSFYGISSLEFKKSCKTYSSAKEQFINSYQNFFRISIILSWGISSILFFNLKNSSRWLIVGEALLVFLYNTPKFTQNYQHFSFRKIPGIKNGIISLIWACNTVILPYLESGQSLWKIKFSMALLFLEIYLLLYSNTLLFDLKDFKRDQLEFTPTLARLWGFDLSKKLAMGLCLIGIFFLYYFKLLGDIPNWGLFLAFSLLFLGSAFSKPNQSPLYYWIGIDGILIIPGLWILILKY